MVEVTHSAVVVLVPEAEPVVAAHRKRLDRAAGWGVGAHVTVLFPFVEPADIDDDVLGRLGAAVACVPRFAACFERTGWFEQDVLYLAPSPSSPFEALTRSVWSAFPETPPYGGAFGDGVTPHLTVGHAPLATPADLEAAENHIATGLPLNARIGEVTLLVGREAPLSWRPVAAFPLAGP